MSKCGPCSPKPRCRTNELTLETGMMKYGEKRSPELLWKPQEPDWVTLWSLPSWRYLGSILWSVLEWSAALGSAAIAPEQRTARLDKAGIRTESTQRSKHTLAFCFSAWSWASISSGLVYCLARPLWPPFLPAQSNKNNKWFSGNFQKGLFLLQHSVHFRCR